MPPSGEVRASVRAHNHETRDLPLALFGFSSALLMACMLVAQFHTGASLMFLQSAHPVETITRWIAENPTGALGLRVSIGLNCIFIVSYVMFFTLLASRFRPMIGGMTAGVGLGAFLVTASIDALGTQHINMMLHSIQNGLPISVWETQAQMVASSLVFHSTYVGTALIALGFAKEGRLGRWIGAMLWFGYLPLGALISACPVAEAEPLFLARYLFFVVSFFVSGIHFLRPAPLAYGRREALAGA